MSTRSDRLILFLALLNSALIFLGLLGMAIDTWLALAPTALSPFA
jgi:predicted small integral membrane protein